MNDGLYHSSILIQTNRHEDELYHHGVPGMKWGRRKATYYQPVGTGRINRSAFKQQLKANRSAAAAQVKKARAEAKQRILDKKAQRKQRILDKKAQRKQRKLDKKDIKRYAKQMAKTGMVGSKADTRSKGKSTAIYNTLVKMRGKAFADAVNKKVKQRRIVRFKGLGDLKYFH